jgi:hypothetical protein
MRPPGEQLLDGSEHRLGELPFEGDVRLEALVELQAANAATRELRAVRELAQRSEPPHAVDLDQLIDARGACGIERLELQRDQLAARIPCREQGIGEHGADRVVAGGGMNLPPQLVDHRRRRRSTSNPTRRSAPPPSPEPVWQPPPMSPSGSGSPLIVMSAHWK